MTLKEKITSDLKEAMKNKEELKRDTLRMLDSSIKNTEIEKKKREEGLSDEEVLEVVNRLAKQRQDSIKQFIEGGRPELAAKEQEEFDVLKIYLPEQLSKEEIVSVVKETISEMSPVGPSDMGKVMGSVMGKVKGKADGNIVRELVKAELEK